MEGQGKVRKVRKRKEVSCLEVILYLVVAYAILYTVFSVMTVPEVHRKEEPKKFIPPVQWQAELLMLDEIAPLVAEEKR